MPKKIIRRDVSNNTELPDSLHPVIKRVLAARDIKTSDDIDYSLASLVPFHDLKGIDSAVDLLVETINNKKRILIVADFDADGATSCALAIRGLNMMGVEDIVYVVPNRFEYGYGLTPEIVNVALEFDPDLLITVDNGISSIDGVKHAKQNGLKVLITDHHLPAEQLPEADAIVNPQLPGDTFPSKNLAGVGVMFYVLLALRARLREQDWFEKNNITYPNLAQLLDLVALGTVADVVPLDKNNRILVAQGLNRIKQNKSIAGIRALLKQAGKNVEALTATDLGFSVAPRLNAAGRLTDMSLGIECLLCDDEHEADEMAIQLDDLNKERRQIQDEMQAQALLELEDLLKTSVNNVPAGICVFKAEWHQGVIGILAAKIKEIFNRPVIAFAKEGEGVLKGSARSITNLHIRDLLEDITRQYPDLILTFGGHAMAAGLTIKEDDFETFNESFNTVLKQHISLEDISDHCLTDGELSGDDFSIRLAYDLKSAGPWGQAFPEPTFDGEFRIIDKRIVGGSHLKLKLQTQDGDKVLDAISFNNTDEDWPSSVSDVYAAYKLDINEYMGNRKLQLIIEHIEPK